MRTSTEMAEAIGANIRKCREDCGLTQKEAADEIWIDRSLLSYIERGKRIPNIFLLMDIADMYQVSMDELIGRKRKRRKRRKKRKNEISS